MLAGACGSSAPSSSRSAPPPPTYVAAANAICARELAQLDMLTRPTTAEQAVSYLPHAISIIHVETEQLAALDPPASGRAQFAAALASDRQLAALLSGFLQTLKTGLVELGTFARVQARSNALRADIARQFRQAGLVGCAR